MQFFEEKIREVISSFWQKFRTEIILIFISFLIIVVSLVVFVKADDQNKEKKLFFEDESGVETGLKPVSTSKIYVDLSGAIEKPDVYQVTSGARLKDVLVLGNGLSSEADRNFFARNFNLARILTDQEKIYIPSVYEVSSGLFREDGFLGDQINPRVNNNVETTQRVVSTDKININIASAEELDSLPGIGKITAEKIIFNRPYSSVEELLTKKIVKKNVYENIKNLITP